MPVDAAHIATDKQIEAMEKHIASIYTTAQKEVQAKAETYLKRFAELDEKKKALVEKGKLSEEEYQTWRKAKIMSGKRYKTMQEQISIELARANETALAYINGETPKTYIANYTATGDGISDAVDGFTYELVDANTVKKLATSDKSLLPPPKRLDIPKDKLWNTRKINAEVLQGVLQGESMDKIAKRMQNVTDMNKTSAIRNARTMVTGAENAGRMDMMHHAQSKGIQMEKIWIATDDARTRDAHNELDGKQIAMDEPFENAIGKIMFPGDPSADGANVYNCRCSLGYHVVGFEKLAVEQVQTTVEETKSRFVPAKTIEEAEMVASQFVNVGGFGSVGLSYSGVHIDVANSINKALTDFYGRFDIPKLGGIAAPAKNTKLGKMINANAAYSPIRQSLLLDRNKTKTAKGMLDSLLADKRACEDVLAHPEKYNMDKLSKRVRAVIENSRVSGRALVPETTEEAIWHEMGHHLERSIAKEELQLIKETMPKYASKISGYATDDVSEYIAESTAAYMRGEKIQDTNIVSIFERLKNG